MRALWIIFVYGLFVISAYALHYGLPVAIEGENIPGVTIQNGDTPFPDGAIYPVPLELQTQPAMYLKIENGAVVARTIAEKQFADLPIKYKKQVEGVWVEMSAQEKHLVDLPAKYKRPDGSEMTDEEKAAVDAALEAARQAAKPTMLKQIENLYVVYLTNDWTGVLRSNGFVASNVTINVTNTSYQQNMTYLIMLRAADRDQYIKSASEFKLFEDTVRNVFGSTLEDVVWHE